MAINKNTQFDDSELSNEEADNLGLQKKSNIVINEEKRSVLLLIDMPEGKYFDEYLIVNENKVFHT